MRHQRRSSARRLAMSVMLCCLASVSACGHSTPLLVVPPPPVWRPCMEQAPAIPDGEVTVAQAEDLLIGTRAALILCEAQGLAIIQAWPR